MAYAQWDTGGNARVFSAKSKPKSIVGFLPFYGRNGGFHPVKVKMLLISEYDYLHTLADAKGFAKKHGKAYITEVVKWVYPSGALRAYLVYGYSTEIAESRGKPGWVLRN